MSSNTKSDISDGLTEQSTKPDYVSKSGYIRRRYKQDLETDENAYPLYIQNLTRAIDRGEIVVLVQGKRQFIDWNKYRHFVFLRWKLSV